jgi:NADPH:quinone reductase-like Zn-dependent oxidoreductase
MEQVKLIPVVGHVLSLERAAEAYRLLMERQNFGKVVLKISG